MPRGSCNAQQGAELLWFFDTDEQQAVSDWLSGMMAAVAADGVWTAMAEDAGGRYVWRADSVSSGLSTCGSAGTREWPARGAIDSPRFETNIHVSR